MPVLQDPWFVQRSLRYLTRRAELVGEHVQMSGRSGEGAGEEPLRKYADAEGYDAYMGGWSAKLAPPFLSFAQVTTDASVLDVGCGTGNLLAAARESFPEASLTGVDPSPALLARARQRPGISGAILEVGAVEALPFGDASFSHTLSLLVLQEFSDRSRALAEMRRVTLPGGVVAGCQWHFARMPIIDCLVEAITMINPEAGRRIGANSPRIFTDEAELVEWWRRAGFEEVETGRIVVTRCFEDFDDIWWPLLRGATPSTLTLASLSGPEQAAVRRTMMARFTPEASGALVVAPEALVVRGRA
jgi:ubiquinone/menaquinone biosynthesis C-methylase UbiE